MVAFTLLTGLLSAVAIQQTDTVVQVDPGSRLVIESFRGAVTIDTWDRDEMRILGDHSSRTYVDVRRSRSAVRLRADAWAGQPKWTTNSRYRHRWTSKYGAHSSVPT